LILHRRRVDVYRAKEPAFVASRPDTSDHLHYLVCEIIRASHRGRIMADERPALQRFKDDEAFYDAHYDELLTRYPEEWVAILDRTVVANDPDFHALLATLKRRGLPADRALIEHLTSHEETLILGAI